MEISQNARNVLEKRYLIKDINGNVCETPEQLLSRVAHNIAQAEQIYGKYSVDEIEQKFFELMDRLEFLPNSPTLMNAGRELQQLAACFVLPVEDSIEGIFDAVKYAALIHKSGGGTGFSFSRLRPKGDVVSTTNGVASGPVSFMKVFNAATEEIKQGGTRKGANMGILRVDHPDILEFISAKRDTAHFTNFNFSVAITDDFMEALANNLTYQLINPRTKMPVGNISANKVFEHIVENAWLTGEPGIVYIDQINQHNPTPLIAKIESTNPCGEQPLLPFESCTLGSINLARFVDDGAIDWDRLSYVVHTAVHFLDNVIDVNKYPLPQIETITKANRKIGLGVMGFADMLIQLGISYESDEALNVAERVMEFIHQAARKASSELAEWRGEFPNYIGSIYDNGQYSKLRNATLTTIAPTGTISMIANCSSGIEPLYAVAYERNVLDKSTMVELNPYFEKAAKTHGFYSQQLMDTIIKQGNLAGISYINEEIRKLYITAHEISPEFHVQMQAVFQKYTDNAVSKTVNISSSASREQVAEVFKLAYQLQCKGITVYRDGSRANQVLTVVQPANQTDTVIDTHAVDEIDIAKEARIDIAGLDFPRCTDT